MAFSRYVQFNITVSSASITTTLQTSVSYDGVSFTFDRPMPVGTFVTGKPFVLSTEAFSITAISPASGVLDGGWAHGAMQDPFTNERQGFDEFLANATSGPKSGNIPYGDNIDPSATGEAIAIAPGADTSIVKSVRLSSVTNPNQWQTIDRYVALTVLGSAPPVGAYAPSSSGLTKTIWTRDDVDETVLRSFAMPGSFADTEGLRASVPDDLGLYGRTGESLRRFRLDNALGTSTSNYSAQVMDGYAKFLLKLHDDSLAGADRQSMIDKVVEFAIQIHGLTTRGWGSMAGRNGGAGQQGGVHPWIYYGAFLLRDPAMLSAAQMMNTSMNANAIWISEADVGLGASGKAGVAAQTFFAEQVGEPWSVPDEEGSHHTARYLQTQTSISAWETYAVLALRAGPGGVSGAEALLGGGPFNSSNPRAAHIAMLDRVRRWSPDIVGQIGPGGLWEDVYDLMQPVTGLTAWSGPPDQVPYGDIGTYRDDIFSTASGGAIAFNLNGRNYATEPVTRVDVRYSLDAIQWIEIENAGTFGSISGLLRGADHWCGMRQVSASGAGLWSPNFPYATPLTSGDDRGKVTTTGSAPSGAAVNTVAPVIHGRLYPAWSYKIWAPLSGTVGVDTIELAAGVGYWSGFPAPTFGFQWMRDGIEISGATTQYYSRTAADAGAILSCVVVANNASGAVSVATAGVHCPAIQAPLNGVLIDTDFRGAFAVDYEAELNALAGYNSTQVHLPTESLDGAAGVNVGAVLCNKSGSYPNAKVPLSRPLVLGQTYRVQAQVGAKNTFTGDLVFNLRERIGLTSQLAGGELRFDVGSDVPRVFDIDETFTASGELEVDAVIAVSTATGGGSGGDAYLTFLRISPI